MTDEDSNRDDVKRVTDILDELDIENLSNLVAWGVKKSIEQPKQSDEAVSGLKNEIEYYLYEERLPPDQYHDLSRVITRTNCSAL